MEDKIKNKIKDGVLDLGCANGWMFEDCQMRDYIGKSKIDGSFKETNLGNCHNEISYKAIFEGKEIIVKYNAYSD